MNKKTPEFACLSLPLTPRNRSGSHVGIILSFVIFITFIVFLYGVVKPLVNTGESKKSMIGYIEHKIVENTTSNLTATSVKIIEDKSNDKLCLQLQSLFNIPDVSSIPYPIIVKDENDEIVSAYIVDLTIPDLAILRTEKKDLFFKVYSSNELNSGLGAKPSGLQCTSKKYPDDYEIGSITIDKYIFESNIVDFKSEYDSNYEHLKTRLNIPPGTEFEFKFRLSDNSVIAPEDNERLKPDTVYVEEIPVQYVDAEANIQSGFISITVW